MSLWPDVHCLQVAICCDKGQWKPRNHLWRVYRWVWIDEVARGVVGMVLVGAEGVDVVSGCLVVLWTETHSLPSFLLNFLISWSQARPNGQLEPSKSPFAPLAYQAYQYQAYQNAKRLPRDNMHGRWGGLGSSKARSV